MYMYSDRRSGSSTQKFTFSVSWRCCRLWQRLRMKWRMEIAHICRWKIFIAIQTNCMPSAICRYMKYWIKNKISYICDLKKAVKLHDSVQLARSFHVLIIHLLAMDECVALMQSHSHQYQHFFLLFCFWYPSNCYVLINRVRREWIYPKTEKKSTTSWSVALNHEL